VCLAYALPVPVAAAVLFYRSLAALLILLPLTLPLALREQRDRQRKRCRELAAQFTEALEAVRVSMQAGASPENAFRDCCAEMEGRFGAGAPITAALRRICAGMDSRIPLETLLISFGEEAQVREIREFARVFTIAKRRGGTMTEVVAGSAQLIRERIETENEIAAALANRRMEQRIMNAVPFLIMAYISAAAPGFFEPLYHNAGGAVFMTVCLAVCLWSGETAHRILEAVL
jgi:tight adherence protein B